MNNLSNRCVTIIRTLLEEKDFIYVERISEKCGVSLRTVRYDLEKIKGWLKDNDSELIAIPKKGIRIPDNEKERIRELLNEDNSDYFFNAEERFDHLLSFFLDSYQNESIEDIGLKTGVSKSTMLRDMEKVTDWFAEHNVQLQRKQHKGIGLDLNERQRRRLIAAYVVEKLDIEKMIEGYAFGISFGLDYQSQSELVKRIQKTIDIRQYNKRLRHFLEENDYEITDKNFVYLFCFLVVQEYRIGNGHFILNHSVKRASDNKSAAEIIRTKFLEKRLGNVPEEYRQNEADYITDIFLAYIGSSQNDSNDDADLTQQIYEYIVRRVYELTRCDISKDQDLNKGMKLHIASMVSRMRMKMPYQNVMLEDIKRQYTDTYNMTSEIFLEIEKKYGIERNENEIGFVALYVNQALERIYKNTERFRYTNVLLICSEGQAAVSFLVKSLQKNFNEIRIVDRISAFKADHYNYAKVNLILTTVDLPFTVLKPVIKVKPILSKRDIARIESFLNKNRSSSTDVSGKELLVNDLYRAIGRYYDIENNEDLKEEIRILVGYDSTPLPTLEEVLKKEYFVANIDAYDWEDAVIQAAEPLLEAKAIGKEYLEEIFALKNEQGQYAVMAKGICLVHAAPDNRNKLSMSLATLKNPIVIQVNENEEPQVIKVMMVFAIKDSIRYAKAIDELFTMFTEYPDLADRLSQGKNAKELVDIIKNCFDNIEW